MPFKPGQSGNPDGRPKGSLNKETLAKLERRRIFDEEAGKMFIKNIRKARPEYILDQYLGKAPDKIELDANIETTTIVPEVLAIAEEELKRRKLEQGKEDDE